MNLKTLTDRTWILLKVSRFPAWAFGPILFSIGVVHSREIPSLKSFALLRAILQIFALSIPLCIGMPDDLLHALLLLTITLLASCVWC